MKRLHVDRYCSVHSSYSAEDVRRWYDDGQFAPLIRIRYVPDWVAADHYQTALENSGEDNLKSDSVHASYGRDKSVYSTESDEARYSAPYVAVFDMLKAPAKTKPMVAAPVPGREYKRPAKKPLTTYPPLRNPAPFKSASRETEFDKLLYRLRVAETAGSQAVEDVIATVGDDRWMDGMFCWSLCLQQRAKAMNAVLQDADQDALDVVIPYYHGCAFGPGDGDNGVTAWF